MSDAIHALRDWLEAHGVRVELFAWDLPCMGLYRSETNQIWINAGPRGDLALMTLAHEAGHWLGYQHQPKTHSYQRERQAFVYGWRILGWLDPERTLITRQAWINEELDRRAAPDVETITFGV